MMSSMTADPGPDRGARIASIDLLRGAVIVLMVLDHARDFFCGPQQQPTNLAVTTPALFFTRWITHFCAPVFLFLAGLGAARYGARRDPGRLSRFLLVRGLWLLLLDVVVVSPLMPDLGDGLIIVGVLWAIGWAMIALAALSRLPWPAVLAVGTVIVAGHNLLDPHARDLARALGPFWLLLRQQGVFPLWPGRLILLAYPVLPWIGVMALGFSSGVLFARPPARRRRIWLALGLAATGAFLVLRALNGYGDPTPWKPQPGGALFTVLSFLNCQKYPPSLLFVLMTLGPALCLLAAVDGRNPATLARPVILFGRVPLFFFLAHFALLRAVSALLAWARWGEGAFRPPPGHAGSPEWPLPAAYLAWAATLLVLYPLCRWFAQLKSRRPEGWLSYL
jgi:uncharacterized membrane protein